jgi:hypothetical protein
MIINSRSNWFVRSIFNNAVLSQIMISVELEKARITTSQYLTDMSFFFQWLDSPLGA